MTGTKPTILVIGASGRFAGMVVPELGRRSVAVRAFLRDPAKADTVRAKGQLRSRSAICATPKACMLHWRGLMVCSTSGHTSWRTRRSSV